MEYPAVGADLSGWEVTDETVETLFRIPTVRVVGATRQYDDERTRAAVRAATGGDLDREWRFFVAARLGFEPSLPPGTPRSAVISLVRSEARDSFRERLVDRGLTGIERGRSERLRVRSGARARLVRYDATDRVAGTAVPVSAWIGVWHDGDIFVAAGGYPAVALCDALGIESEESPLARSPELAREELIEFIRSVH